MKVATRKLRFETLDSRQLLAGDALVAATAASGDGVTVPAPEQVLPGDANLDGVFDSSDLVEVFRAGKYLSEEPATWAEGDWNGDRLFDSQDLVAAMQTGAYQQLAAKAKTQGVDATLGTLAEVVFDDGKMHVIDDDSYAFTRIEVRDGSKLRIEEGAVIAASISQPWDWNSGVPVLEFSAGAIQVFDTSQVIVQGGVFGGDRTGTPGCTGSDLCQNPFADNWYSGSIAAFDQAKVIIQDGTHGTCAFRSGTTAMFDESSLIVSGGTFTDPGGTSSGGLGCQAGGGRIELWDDAQANISGGLHASNIVQENRNENDYNNSTLRISGGTFGKDNLPDFNFFFRGSLSAQGNAVIKISGGTFGADSFASGEITARDAAIVDISGGTFGGTGLLAANLDINDSAFLKITGGQFDGSNINVNSGLAKIEGSAFNLPFGPADATERQAIFGGFRWLGLTQLEGVLASGEEINVTIGRADVDDAIINLVEE